uniref:Nidogen n=1 Tax=Suberites domuncula TaxID=55567 RepID=U3UBS8_SUBDO|nr:nidogen [Suberites domuncula]
MFLQEIILVAILLLHTVIVSGYEGTQGNHLQFVTLGRNGVSVFSLPRSDDGSSSAINIYPAINFGSSQFSSAYISVNGFISFTYNDGIAAESTTPFFPSSSDDYIIAPFWADADTRSTGQVRYEVHKEYSPYSSSQQLRSQIGTYITDVTGDSAHVSSLLVVEWRDVPQFSSSQPTNTNTFQALVATTSSSRFYAIFTYTCGDLS